MSTNCIEELNILLKAKVPCIWIQSYEEEAIINSIKRLIFNDSKLKHMSVNGWSHTSGLQKLAMTKEEIQEPPSKQLMSFDKLFSHIDKLQDSVNKEEGVYILKDLHLINDNASLKRALRDLKEKKTNSYNPIIVISPVVSIPLEHEKLFTVLEYELPDSDLIAKILKSFVVSMEKQVKNGSPLKMPDEELQKAIIKSCLGLTMNEIAEVLTKSVMKYNELSLDSILEHKIQLIKKSGVLDYKMPITKFEDIGGNHVFKNWISEIEDSRSEEAIAFGCSAPKGFLSLGLPGTSKTLMAEALAERWNYPLLVFDASKIYDKLVGQSERNIAQAFRIAKSCSPCVLLIDEIEKTLSGSSGGQSDAGTSSRVFGSVLNFLSNPEGVYTIMTSNDVSQLPPELTRIGRLDASWYFSVPTESERKEIFEIHLRKVGKKVPEDIIDLVAKSSQNYTGAEIEQVVISSVRKAFKRFKEDNNPEITKEDLMNSVSDIIPLFESSKETVMFLESWAKGRARNASIKHDELGFNPDEDHNLEFNLMLDSLND